MPAKFISVVRIGRAMTHAIDAGHDQIAERVDGGGFERVDLLGHLHRAELGADARADPSREQKPGRKGAGFTHERNGQARRNHRFRAESFQRGPRVHGEDDADRHARDGDQRRVKVLVLNGRNLGRLGRRQPEVYGSTTYAELVALCHEWGRSSGLEVDVRQTNHEGELLDWLNQAADDQTPVVLNAAAWTHYSYALFDACAQLTAPLVEVHISDPKSRPEEFRPRSLVTPYAAKEIVGEGIDGYRLALEFLASRPTPG